MIRSPHRARGQGPVVLLAVVALVVALVLLVTSSYREVDQRELVVWTAFKDSEIAVLRKAADAFEQSEHVPVRIVRVPFQELQPKIQVSVPVGQGPDLVTGPHDWIGTFVQAGMLVPAHLDGVALQGYIPVAVQAMRYGGAQYGLPLSVSTLGLVTNRAMVKEPPKSISELIEKAQALTGNGKYGFLFDDLDFYFAYPFFGGEGAFIFASGPEGLDPFKLGLDNEGAVKAGYFLADLHHRWKLIPVGTNKNSANAAFLNHNCAMTITGPWSLEDYRRNKIDYVFTPIPPMADGRWPQPLVGVDGLMLTRSSKNPQLAAKLMQALASSEPQVELNLSAGRIPARKDAQADPRVAANPDVKAIGESVDRGIPMPSIPETSQVWGPMEDALKMITTGQREPEAGLREATARILNNIRKMRE